MRLTTLISLTTLATFANAQLDNTGGALDAAAKGDHRRFLHGVFMCLTFLLIFPIGAISRRCTSNTSVHMIFQIIGLLLAIAGAAVGIACSVHYDKGRHFSSPHQIIGMVIILALLGQSVLAYTNRRLSKKNNTPTTTGKVHKYLGWSIILIGVVNGGVGLKFADETFLLGPYIGIVIALLVVFGSIFWCARRFRRRKATKSDEPDGYQQPQFEPGLVNGHAAPPPYAPYAYHGNQDVPLQAYTRPGNETQRVNHSNGGFAA